MEKNKTIIGLLSILLIFLCSSITFAAPVISMDDIIIGADASETTVPLYILTTPDFPVESIAVKIGAHSSIAIDTVDIFAPTGWIPTVSLPKFGATDFGWPPNPITNDYHFADLHISFPEGHFTSDAIMEQICFSWTELSDDMGMSYSNIEVRGGMLKGAPVPIPAAAWLLGAGLAGLLGFSRRNK